MFKESRYYFPGTFETSKFFLVSVTDVVGKPAITVTGITDLILKIFPMVSHCD